MFLHAPLCPKRFCCTTKFKETSPVQVRTWVTLSMKSPGVSGVLSSLDTLPWVTQLDVIGPQLVSKQCVTPQFPFLDSQPTGISLCSFADVFGGFPLLQPSDANNCKCVVRRLTQEPPVVHLKGSKQTFHLKKFYKLLIFCHL